MIRWQGPPGDPGEAWDWYMHLWRMVCELRERYRLPVRSRWWEDAIQLEALSALSAWVLMYDFGEWDDPPGRLALLYDLERVALLLRSGQDPFDPVRDKPGFERWVQRQVDEEPPGDAARWPLSDDA